MNGVITYGVFCGNEILAVHTKLAHAQEDIVFYERNCCLPKPDMPRTHTIKIVSATKTLEMS